MCRIPVPSGELAKDCLDNLKLLERFEAIHPTDPIELRLEILISCFNTGDSPTAEALKQQLNAVRNYKPD